MSILRRLAFCALLLFPLALPAPAALAAEPAYHFVGGRLLTMAVDAPPVTDAELLVVGERIEAIGTSLEVPEGARRIDLGGGYLMPGLTEMHAHVPAPERGDTYRDDVLFLYVANGVTTIRGMLGHPEHLRLRADIAAHRVLGPRLITSGPSFNGNSVTSPEQARAMVQTQVQAGYDFLKVHPGLTLAEYDAMAETARRSGIPFAGHVPAEVGLLHALAAGQATIDHLDGYIQALVPSLGADTSGLFAYGLASRVDESLLAGVVQATLEAGSAVVPTETLLENFAATDLAQIYDRPQNAYLPADLLDNYRRALEGRGAGLNRAAARRFLELRKRLIGALQEAGVPLLLGSDAPQIFNVPGFSLHRELAAMTAAGLSPHEALLMGTRNPAAFFGEPASFGTLAPGRAADLVWLGSNPLHAIGNSKDILGVMVRGRWLDRATLDEGLAAIADRHRR